MNEVRLPALTGDSPLGILAAIGVLRLLTDFTQDAPTLRWDPTSLTAVLCGKRQSVDEVEADLLSVIDQIPDGSLLPGVGPGFPPPGAAPDGLRLPQDELRYGAHCLLAGMTAAEQFEARHWLVSLVTDLAVDDKHRVAISQFTAPSGKQSMATMLEKPLELIRQERQYIGQALRGWRRIAGVTGEYLDHRAMWDATEDGGGATGLMRGVPGATWLALMSYPLLRTTANGKRPLSSGWHTLTEGRRRYDELRLPVWGQPLGTAAVTALIEHPALAPLPRESARAARTRQDQLEALRVLHICRSRRYQPPGGKSAGVLTPIR